MKITDIKVIELRTPVVRARYEFAEAGDPTLAAVVEEFLARDVRHAPETRERCATDG